ncbi:hypothetical protein F5141DRAFT_1213084 [Pisolithus sp. B1]|nr:hypothetical protein F5141DRAFT_1213084 [Pisolithus sp. B1]
MKAALIPFHYLPTSHTGEELAKTILHLTNHAKIPVDKIGHFTMDNTANNNTAMAVFAQILQEECKFEILLPVTSAAFLISSTFAYNTLSTATSVQIFLAF